MPPDDDSGRRLSQPTPATTPTAATTPEITATLADSGDAVAVEAAGMTLLEAALFYQQAGWSVVPAAVSDKRALVPWRRWQTSAADPDQLRSWWHRWPRANPAVVTGRISSIVVLDIDPRAGGDRALAELERHHGDLSRSAVTETPSGGVHVYLAHPGGRVANSASRIGLGVDVRGDGGLVLAPPSRRPDGAYRWAVGAPSSVPRLPTAWVELLRPPTRRAVAGARAAPGDAQGPQVGSGEAATSTRHGSPACSAPSIARRSGSATTACTGAAGGWPRWSTRAPQSTGDRSWPTPPTSAGSPRPRSRTPSTALWEPNGDRGA